MSDIAPKNKNVRDDEIDLLDLLSRIGSTLMRWFNMLLNGFMISVIFLLRRWLPLLLSVLAGIALSYILKSTSDSFYTSDIVLRNNLILPDKKNMAENYATTSELISKINKLHMFCAESNLPALSSAISMTPESAKNISDISAFWIIDASKDGVPDYVDYKGTHSVYDTVNIRMPSCLDIRVKIVSTLNLDQVRDGIIKFIESDSLYQQRNRLRIHQNNEMLGRLSYDIKQLDSLQKVKYFEETRNMQPKNGGQIVFMQEQKTQLVYSDIYNLYTKKQFFESEKELYKGIVTILSDFSLPTRRENGAMYYGKNIIPLIFFLTLAVLILLANRKRIKDIFEKY
jgi:hypothetical protein